MPLYDGSARQGLADEAVLLCQQMHAEELEELRLQQSTAFARAMAMVPSDASPEQVAAEEDRLRKAQALERAALQGRQAEQLAKLVSQDSLGASVERAGGKSLMTEIKSKMEAERARRLKAIQVRGARIWAAMHAKCRFPNHARWRLIVRVQEEHEEYERIERAKIEANMAKMLAEMEAQRSARAGPPDG
jgi:hypothetical protein